MTRLLLYAFLRVWPGVAFMALAAAVGYVLGYKYGYITCMGDIARGSHVWPVQP